MKATLLTLPRFLSPLQCQALVDDAERRGFGAAPVTTGFGFVMMPELRNNTRVMVDDVPLAEQLWQRLSELVRLEPVHSWQPTGLNERLRYYRYDAGQAFRWHRDGAFVRSDAEQSLLTFMIYLSEDFDGGATEFEHTRIAPRLGDAIVFTHGLRHQGGEVTRGRKYVLRSDVMFRNCRARA